jgi:short-subunit dehydrogenase
MNDGPFFRDKVVIVTGASSGIGRAAAGMFARLGAKVVLASRNEEKLDILKKEIESEGGEAIAIPTDVCSFEDTQKMSDETVSKWGRIDILIANAGRHVQDATREIQIQSFEQSMAVNFYGVLNAVKCVLPRMRKAKKGHIVIVNSLDAKKGIVGDGPYVAAKSALDGFGDVLRQELRSDKIRLTSVYPGRVDTPMIQNIKVPWISPKISPENVARAMVKGIRRNKPVVIVPSHYYLLGSLNNMFPGFADWAYRLFRIEGEKIQK